MKLSKTLFSINRTHSKSHSQHQSKHNNTTPESLSSSSRPPSLLLLLATLVLVQQSAAEVFTSTHDLRQVFQVERSLVDALGKYLVKAETRLGRIRRYIQEYEAVQTDLGWVRAGDIEHQTPRGGPAIFVEQEDEPVDSTASDNTIDESALETLAGNPLHTFHLMKRLTVYWKHIDASVLQEEWNRVLIALYGEKDSPAPSPLLPGDEDLQGAAQALVRLHHVYRLNVSSLVRGDVLGVQSAAELTAQDCLYMGKHSFNLAHYSQSIEWFTEAYALAGYEKNITVTQDQVAEFLNTAIKAHDTSQSQLMSQHPADSQIYPPSSYTSEGGDNQEEVSIFATNSDPSDSTDSVIDLQYEEETGQFDTPVPQEDHFIEYDLKDDLPEGFMYNSPYDDEENFFALCRGEKLLTPEAESQLYCQYDTRGSPYLLLMPAKVEHHHASNAGLVTFHDVLSVSEIAAMKLLADPALSRAMVQGVQGKGNTVSNTRTSKVAWLDDTDHPVVERVDRRIEQLTGLSLDQLKDHSEMLQVANYGIGGHYNPHHDYLLVDKTEEELANINPRELSMGDRVATFMFYLSDVTRGGATAFPRLGTAVWPKKGSAAFWYNMKRSGAGNVHTLHGGCPVVHGSKWVSNKWIRERGQFQTRPCDLDPRQ